MLAALFVRAPFAAAAALSLAVACGGWKWS